jgi:hypothetical protein
MILCGGIVSGLALDSDVLGRESSRRRTLTDGPFTEAKEVIGGRHTDAHPSDEIAHHDKGPNGAVQRAMRHVLLRPKGLRTDLDIDKALRTACLWVSLPYSAEKRMDSYGVR